MSVTRETIHAARTPGEYLSDLVVGGMGSWRFIIIQSIIVCLWIAANIWLLARPFDAFPFILLNLLFSTQAAYASPLILMSQNRQAAKDRARDDLEADEISFLYEINKEQLDILRLLHKNFPENGKGGEM